MHTNIDILKTHNNLISNELHFFRQDSKTILLQRNPLFRLTFLESEQEDIEHHLAMN